MGEGEAIELSMQDIRGYQAPEGFLSAVGWDRQDDHQ